jgi:nitroreductase
MGLPQPDRLEFAMTGKGGFEMIRDLILRNRSYRRFYQEVDINLETLRELVDLARFSPSARNAQPLKYILSCEHQRNSLIFPHLAWAGYLTDWSGPCDEERPSAYIVILGDTEIGRSFGCDHGIAAQSIMLGATEKGLGGCIIASIEKEGLRKALKILPQYEILLVLALGKPKETVVIEKVRSDGDIKYWRDSKGVHHVPKRPLDDIIIG